MTKTINDAEADFVKRMVELYMDAFHATLGISMLSPEKGAHLINLGIVSFVATIATNLDKALGSLAQDSGYTPLNMHGKVFPRHLDFFVYMLQNSTKKEY